MSKDKPTPFVWNGRRNHENRVNIRRAESPDCTGQTTNTTFISREELETRFNAASTSLRIPFLFRELGLRLLYNTDNDNYYSHLRSQNTYQDDFTRSSSNTDYAHKLFSNIRNNHRFLKSKVKKGSKIDKKTKIIKFSEEAKVKETYQSKPYMEDDKYDGGYKKYLDTLDQEVIYLNDPEYNSYKKINQLIIDHFGNNNYSLIAESFKRILKGEALNSSELTDTQTEIIYTLFYHLFVIEGSRDPASYITIPLAFEYLATHGGNIFGTDSNSPEIIPVCFTNAMQALSYMGDVTFKSLTSIQYSHSYNGTNDAREDYRIGHSKTIQQKTNSLLKKHLELKKNDELPDFSFTIDTAEDICKQWYGFTPQMEAPQIQFFGQLGLTATDVPRDGNCFFHVLAKYCDKNAFELRTLAANLFNNNDTIRGNGNWIDLDFSEIAETLARAWNINIVLVQQNTALDQIDTMLEANLYRANTPDAGTIYIGNIGNMHFVDLTPQEGDSFNQLQAAVNHIVNPQPPTPPVVEEPLENLGNLAQAIEQAANESDEEEESTSEKDDSQSDDSSNSEDSSYNSSSDDESDEETESASEEDDSSSDTGSNSTINALYNINYDNLDFLNHKENYEPYQLTVDEKYLIDSFVVDSNEYNYSTEQKIVILPQEINDFTLEDMSIVLGKMLNYFSQ